MQAFKSLWRPRGNITIPTYTIDDGVDLQVKSLLYMFKRLCLSRAGDKLEPQPIEGITDEDMESLDKLYNLEGFLRVVLNDPHRVLVDWPKNRFRAMLIIAHMPQMEQLPEFGEPHFKFTVLEADTSSDDYIRTLSQSDIYIEHNLPLEIRREIAASVVHKLRPRTLQSRQQAIFEYLRLVATEIQVARIYKAMLSKLSPQRSPQQSPQRSPQQSPQRSPQQSPQHSPQHSRSSSPVRSPPSPTRPGVSRFPKVAPPAAPKLSSSPPKLNASPLHQPQQSPPGSPPRLRIKQSQPNLKLAGTPNLNNSHNIIHSLDAGRKHVLQQARLAVKARIEKEQKALSSVH